MSTVISRRKDDVNNEIFACRWHRKVDSAIFWTYFWIERGSAGHTGGILCTLNQDWDASTRSRKADWGGYEPRNCELHNLRHYLPKIFISSITIQSNQKSKCAHKFFCLKLSPLKILHLNFILKIPQIMTNLFASCTSLSVKKIWQFQHRDYIEYF